MYDVSISRLLLGNSFKNKKTINMKYLCGDMDQNGLMWVWSRLNFRFMSAKVNE